MPDDRLDREAHEPRDVRGLAQHYLKDLVYGASDGINTTFAVVAGVAGAQLDSWIGLIVGFANLLADGSSMGASNFLSIRSDQAILRISGRGIEEPFPARLALAVVLTPTTLFVVGAARAAVTRGRWWTNGAEMLLVGAVAAGVAYRVGGFVDRVMG